MTTPTTAASPCCTARPAAVTAPLPIEPDGDEAVRSLLGVTDAEAYARLPTDIAPAHAPT